MSVVTLTGPARTTDAGGAPLDAVVEVVIDVDAGARIASIRLSSDEHEVAVLAPDPSDGDPESVAWGSFPMAPWAGRLRHGRFAHADGDIHLARGHLDRDETGGESIRPPLPPLISNSDSGPDVDPSDEPSAHAIHGTTFGRPWTIEAQTTSSLTTSCHLGDVDHLLALGWPYGGIARQTFVLTDRAVDVTLVVEADDRSFEAVIGWHPWFPKPIDVRFEPTAQYELDALGMPTGRQIEPGPPPWDDCFVSNGPVELRYDRPMATTITVASDCDHWVVFDKPPLTTCVEPQSGPPDAVNHRRWETSPPPSARPHLVTVDAPLRRTMSIAW